MSDGGLSMWVVYDHPKDFPDYFVARQWRGEQPTENVIMASGLELIHHQLIDMGLVKLERMQGDDPKILETWL
jgi:hypothetical protein